MGKAMLILRLYRGPSLLYAKRLKQINTPLNDEATNNRISGKSKPSKRNVCSSNVTK